MNARIDGVEVFLRENPAFTYNFYDFIDPTKVKGDTATSIEVSATADAERVLGSRAMAENPSRRDHALDVGPGYWKGRVAVIERAEGVIRCESVAGNGGWIGGAKDLKLRTLPMGTSNTITPELQRLTWYDDNFALYFPLIDYGSFEGQLNTFNVQAKKLRPGVRVWKVLAQAFGMLGYSLDVQGRLQGLWKKLVLPNTKDNLQGDEATRLLRNAEVQMSEEVLFPVLPGPIGADFSPSFPIVLRNFGGTWNAIDNRAQPLFDMMLSARVFGTITIDGNAELRIGVLLNGDLVSDTILTPTSASGTLKTYVMDSYDTLPAEVLAGQWAQLRIAIVDVTSIAFVTINPLRVLWDPVKIFYQDGITIDTASACPDMTVGELVKDLTALLCLTWTTNEATGTVTVRHYDDTLKPSSQGIDFRGREDQVDPVKVTSYAPGQYRFRYNNDNKDRTLQLYESTRSAPGYANADRTIPDGTEPPKDVQVTFAATAMGQILGALWCPVMYEDDGEVGDDFVDYVPRILVADGVITPANTWVHAGATQTVQPKCYFVYPGETRYGMAWNAETQYGAASAGLVEQHYRNRLERLATAYVLRIDLRLDDDELLSFDFTRPVYVDDGYGGGWYYIIKVDQKQFGTDAFTRCDLLQL